MKLTILTLIPLIFSLTVIPVWAQENEYLGDDFFDNPIGEIFGSDGSGIIFLMFIIGIAIYALFVWYFYRSISKRDMLPKIFYKLSKDDNPSIVRRVSYVILYAVLFPIIIFVWFVVLAFFVYLIAEGMPMTIAIFVSMSVIAVVRILSYYREDAAKEVAKMIPYAILAFLLTTVAVYQNPNFFTEKELGSTPLIFQEKLEAIVFAVVIVSIFEYSFRVAFMIKRKYRPVSEKTVEDNIAKQVEDITKIHFKKIEGKEKEIEKKVEELLKKLKDAEKNP
jgi:hypothetical protein